MKRSWIIIAVLVAAVLAGPALIYAGGSKQKEPSTSEVATSDARPPEAGNSMMAAVDPSKAVFDLSGLAPAILPFSTEAAAQALASRKQVVYFFAASWCPTCREAYRNLKADASSIPEDLVIVVVDYDKSAALKAKYGVSYQHTFIKIDSAGESLKAWSGTSSVSDIVANATTN